MPLDAKYYQICNTDKSDKISQPVMSEEDITYNLNLVNYNIKEIDRLLGEIEFLRLQNFYIQHNLVRNGQ